MLFLTFAHHYLWWHYTQAIFELLHVYRNFVWFFARFFSLTELFGSLFAPFRRITEDAGRPWNLEDLAARIIINTISRIIGAIIRSVLIFCGLIVLTLLTTSLLVVLVAWFFAPALITIGCLYGIIFFLHF